MENSNINDDLKDNQPQKNSNEKNINLKKKTKKFNGFLRNNQKKHNGNNKNNQKDNSNFSKDNSEDDISIDVSSNNQIISNKTTYKKETQEEYEIFTFLRQKTGFNEHKFWENLSKTLKEKSFIQIRGSDLSLISYAVLHESENVFEKLLNNFGKEIDNNEYINYVFKYGIHKNPFIIETALNFYEKNFTIENEFLTQFIKDIAHISYRSENNDVFLNWLKPKINDELLNLFWTECFNKNNIPLIQKSIQHPTFSQYLKKHHENFNNLIEKCGRKFEINQALNSQKNTKKVVQKVDNNNETAKINNATNLLITENFEPKIWLSDKSEQFKVIEENLSDKKPTEVIIRRKRKIA